jgi:hypothetical protein
MRSRRTKAADAGCAFGIEHFQSKIANRPWLSIQIENRLVSLKDRGQAIFWRPSEIITVFADWFDRFLRDRRA